MSIARIIVICILAGVVVAPSLIGMWFRRARQVRTRHIEPEGIELDDDDYAMLIIDYETGQEWRIYQDGQVSGWEGRKITIINRIPALVAAAGELGYSEAESLKDIPETKEEWFRQARMQSDLDKYGVRPDHGRKQEG